MNRNILLALLALLMSLPVGAQQSQAKAVLDRVASTIRRAGGIEAAFSIKNYSGGRNQETDKGTIRLKGEKFVLKTSGVNTWFDGRTQWSYLESSGEVNISNPTPEELQSINPYALLYMYQKGFSYRLGTAARFGGKAVKEVVLTATSPHAELSRIVLYVASDTYLPTFIRLEQNGAGNRSEITVTGYKTGQRYSDNLFVFDPKQFPDAEIIDLR